MAYQLARSLHTGGTRSIRAGIEKFPIVVRPTEHTMGSSLERYLQIKVHSALSEQDHSKITIRGSHLRNNPARISSIEKTGKLFNWQRPTTVSDTHDGGIELHCFPGRDYVQHYAGIVASYLALQKRDTQAVRYIEPGPEECIAPFLESNLRKLSQVDVVVLGYVHGLSRLTGSGSWIYGDETEELFAWKTFNLPSGGRGAFLGCRVSFWGDISGTLVRALQQLCQVKCVLYIGKLGSLVPEHVPNQFLATGNTSTIYGADLSWPDPLAHIIQQSGVPVIQGRHVTLPSVLDETHDWLAAHRNSFEWVDPEIGHMAMASVAGHTEFGYLHIISDNLAKKYSYDLSNERLRKVLEDRIAIVGRIEDILEKFLRTR